jgi:hypothetical protein
MSVRVSAELALQIGEDNNLDQGHLVGDGSIAELVDSLDKAGTEVVVLDAGQINVLVVTGDIRLLYIEAEGDVDFWLSGVAATVAEITGSGGTFPTGFAGGETLDLSVDGVVFTTTFLIGDQTLAQVMARINAAAALAGVTGFPAKNASGQLEIESLTSGSGSVVVVSGGSGRATIGLPLGTSAGLDPVAATAPVRLRRLADASSSQVAGLRAWAMMTVRASSVYLSNPSDTDAVRCKVISAAGLAATEC